MIFGVDEGVLKILLIERNEPPFKGWKAIPGNLVMDKEDIDDAAKRILYELTGLKDIFLEQSYTFGRTDRHPQGRVITVAYYSLIRKTDDISPVTTFAKKAFWWPVYELSRLAFDHNEIVLKALDQLKHKVNYQPIGFELLPREFTLTQLQHVYEAILEKRLDKRNFRKKILSQGLLEESNRRHTGGSHRSAAMFRFNRKRYEQYRKKGTIFGF
ncbi:MAG: NUDIX hydrolase [Bacteroidota bacterium]